MHVSICVYVHMCVPMNYSFIYMCVCLFICEHIHVNCMQVFVHMNVCMLLNYAWRCLYVCLCMYIPMHVVHVSYVCSCLCTYV